MIVGMFAFGILNIPIVWLLFSFVGNYSWLGWIYYFLIGFFWIAFADVRLTIQLISRAKLATRNMELSKEKTLLTEQIIDWMNN